MDKQKDNQGLLLRMY